MPYSSVSDVPANVPKKKRKQWLEVFNSAYERATHEGKEAKEAEASAFAQANSVAGPNSKMWKSVGYVICSSDNDQCQFCEHYQGDKNCNNHLVMLDDTIPPSPSGYKLVEPKGWCEEYSLKVKPEEVSVKVMKENFKKFIPFVKVDAQKREVWGIVTAEVPDKDCEVCGYAESKPFYQAVIDEMAKATDSENFMPLREMHQPSAVGKGIGYEFRDADKEIFMGFKVVDDKAWKKVEEKVYTGFSHGGGYAPVFKLPDGSMTTHIQDPVFTDCLRYAAKPAEVSLVDNPCVGVAHFTYVSKTGEIELRKNRSTVASTTLVLEKTVKELKEKVEALFQTKSTTTKEASSKTKRVAGEDLPSEAFLIVGDKEKTNSWHLPVKFSSDAKTKRHIRNALARIDQVKGISEAQRDAARKRLSTMAAQHGIDVASEKMKLAVVTAKLRRMARGKISKYAREIGDPGHKLSFLDSDLGKLSKGMCEVSNLSWLVQDLSCLVYNVVSEQEWEGDETSPLPGMLEASMDQLLDTLIAMVAEEAEELRDQVADRVG